MKKIVHKKPNPFFLQEIESSCIQFEKEDYEIRIRVLKERMREQNISHVVIYGDREHFANTHYFSGYDCRFEEALLIFDSTGEAAILVGNEGISQTYQIPYEINVCLYQNFSLQGQSRNEQKSLSTIFSELGIDKNSRVGVVGYKYFDQEHIETNPNYTFDIPAYVLSTLQNVCVNENVINFTKEITGFPNGIRHTIRTAKEIAWAEAAGNKVASVILRLFKRLKPGLSEQEAGYGISDFDPINVFPMINFGENSARIGVKSPGPSRLVLGEVLGLAYSLRGNLTARVGVASYDKHSVAPKLQEHLGFYEDLWLVVAELLETLTIGAKCSEIHDRAMAKIGDPKYGVSLNVTHYTGADEWTNSPVYEGSPFSINDGAHIQVDVIASNPDPLRTAICEDCVIIAGKELREQLKAQYPEVYDRIVARQNMIRSELNIQIHDDCLPMSNLTGVYFPFMLNLDQIFALEQ